MERLMDTEYAITVKKKINFYDEKRILNNRNFKQPNQKRINKTSDNGEMKKKNKVADNENKKKNKNKVADNEKKNMSIKEPRKKKAERRGIGYDIPEELIFSIFLRLPVKSLIRFQAVSKTWNGLTTDPKFIHLHHSLQPSSKLLLVERKEHDDDKRTLYPMPLTFSKQSKKLCASRNVYEALKPIESADSCLGDIIRVFGPCYGVFCTVSRDKKKKCPSYTLCNIATREVKVVPDLRLRKMDHRVICRDGFGFGCVHDNLVPEFKLVKLSYLSGGFDCLTHVYTSTTNSWKMVEPCESLVLEEGIELNGVIYWRAREGLIPPLFAEFNVILTFDLKKEVFGKIELPCGDTRSGGGALLTKQDERCLSLVAPSNDYTDIWTMCGGDHNWIRQARIGASRVEHRTLLGYWNRFKGLLVEDLGDDDEDMGVVMVIDNKRHKYCIEFSNVRCFNYVESLVSFNF